MTAATTRLWVPNLWLPRTEFRLRRSRSIEDDQTLVRLDSGVAVESHVLDTGSGPVLPIGGDHSLRGVKPYTLLAPTVTLPSPYGTAAWNTAVAAAGVNGKVRVPHAASGVAASPTFNVAGQTIQLEQAATVLAGGFTVTGNGVTVEGGQSTGRIHLPRTGSGHNFTLRNHKKAHGGQHYDNESRSGAQFINCEFTFTTNGCVTTLYNRRDTVYDDLNVDGWLLKDSILLRTGGSDQSMIAGNDSTYNAAGQLNGYGVHTMKNFMVDNCYIDGGTFAQGWFGTEVWNNRPNAQGIGGVVRYSDLRGGHVLMSMVRSEDNLIHHNNLRINVGFATYELSGITHQRGVYEFNKIIDTRPGITLTGYVYQNSGADLFTIRNNMVELIGGGSASIKWLLGQADPNGGGHTVEDNCLPAGMNVAPASGWGTANTIGANNPTACGF